MTNKTYTEEPFTRLPLSHGGVNETVVLFGEMLADIFPERSVLGGAPFNVARHLKAFGQKPVLITRLGQDALRDEMIQVMNREGMEIAGIQSDSSHPTGKVQVEIINGEPHYEIVPKQAYDFIDQNEVHNIMHSIKPAMIYFGTLAQRNKISASALNQLLDGTNATKFLDINLREPWFDEQTLRVSMQKADIVKINDDELNKLVEMLSLPEGTHQQQACELAGRFEIAQMIVTCGSKGAWMASGKGKTVEAKIENKLESITDTVGAGDGFASVCILGAIKGWSASLSMRRANTFAAKICGIRGAIPENKDFYEQFFREWAL